VICNIFTTFFDSQTSNLYIGGNTEDIQACISPIRLEVSSTVFADHGLLGCNLVGG
jgi:hypothetical protein